MGALAAIGAIVGIVGSIVGIVNGINSSSQADTANSIANKNVENNQEIASKNFELSKEQFEYQKELNQTVMNREDTAFQRQIADLKAAGLSPLNIAGGSPATALTSANAPQFDMSGINQAVGNLIGAYNDSFNRQMSKNQFALQAKGQTAQLYTQLAENYRDQKQAQLEYKYLDEKLKWEKKHGFRDLDWKSDLTKVIEDVLEGNRSSVLPGFGEGNQIPDIKTEIKDLIDEIKNPELSSDTDIPVKSKLDIKAAKQAARNQKKQIKDNKWYYNWSINLLETRTPDEYGKNKLYTQALDFYYRHTDAHKDFDTVYLFRNALKKDRELYKKYKLND